MLKRLPLFVVALAAELTLATTAQAAFTIYTDRSTWAAATGGITGGEDFNGFTNNVSYLAATVALSSGMSIGVSFNDGLNAANVIDAPPLGDFRADIDGTTSVFASTGFSIPGHADPFVKFASAIKAFGADFKDMNNLGLTTRLDFYNGTTLLGSYTPPGAADGVERFIGFVGDAVTEVRFVGLIDQQDQFGIDNIQIAAATAPAVPEPATLALLGAGALALGWTRRNRAA